MTKGLSSAGNVAVETTLGVSARQIGRTIALAVDGGSRNWLRSIWLTGTDLPLDLLEAPWYATGALYQPSQRFRVEVRDRLVGKTDLESLHIMSNVGVHRAVEKLRELFPGHFVELRRGSADRYIADIFFQLIVFGEQVVK